MNSSFWGGRRVFVTGHTGFKGGWLSLWLQNMGALTSGFSLAPETTPNFYQQASVGDGMDSRFGDIRDLGLLREAIIKFRPEIVFHLAAQPLVRRSYVDPIETYSTNVMGTINLLEAIRMCPSVLAVVVITSDKCYENKEWAWAYREIEPMGGADPYSSSKGCAELVCSAYMRSFFTASNVSLATARAGNVIGGGDWAEDRLIPDIIRASATGKELIIRNPGAIRPWQHVLEPLSGYLTLAEKLVIYGKKYVGGWNFGPTHDDARSVSSIVETMKVLMGRNILWSIENSVLHEANFLTLDSSKAKFELNWRPHWTLDKALSAIVEWIDAKNLGFTSRQISIKQILDYQDGFKK